MRIIPSELQARLDTGVTTLCRCWVLTRRDGVTLGFTDHDEDVQLGEISCRAGGGLAGTEVVQELGLAVTGTEISGALTSEALSEADLAAGKYDAAEVLLYMVDWTDPSLNVLMSKNSVGEVRREGASFTAELRGLADRLSQEGGRLYTATCSADLGDNRCKVELAGEEFSATGAVVALNGVSIAGVSGLEEFGEGWFTAGKLTWNSGANEGLSAEVKRHRIVSGEVWIELWQAMPQSLAIADEFQITAGCDKKFSTCRNRFANTINFRGFPHTPGNDFVASYAVEGEPGHDGASLQEDA